MPLQVSRRALSAVALARPFACLAFAGTLGFLACPQARAAEEGPAPVASSCPPSTEGDSPTDAQLEAAGVAVGDIRIDGLNIFDTRLQEEDNALFKLANWLHVKTRDTTLLQQLLVKPGDRYDARLLRESERVLRANGYLHDAHIEPAACQDGRVDLVLSTQDVWTLKPGISFGRKGGRNSSSVGIQETNLLGFGNEIGLDYSSGVDRSSKTLSYRDRHLGGSWWTLSGEYADNSDGKAQKLTLERPFHALDSRDAGGISLRNQRRTDSVYREGQMVDQFGVQDRGATVYAGRSNGLQDGSALRWTAGFTFDELRYSALPASVSGELPQGRRLVYPWIGLTWVEDRYQATQNQDQIGKTEDVALGWNVQARFGAASTGFGSDRNALPFGFSMSKGWQPTPAQTLLMSASVDGRYQREGFTGTLMNLSTRYYYKQTQRSTFFASAAVDRGIRLDGDQQILLGGDSGLRGYPLRYQSGHGRWLLTAEQRVFSDWYPFRIFRVGGAAFYDMGRTWDGSAPGDSSRGLLRDVGFGLRLGNSRSALGTVVHIDAAFPLDGDATIKKVQFVIEAKRSF